MFNVEIFYVVIFVGKLIDKFNEKRIKNKEKIIKNFIIYYYFFWGGNFIIIYIKIWGIEEKRIKIEELNYGKER